MADPRALPANRLGYAALFIALMGLSLFVRLLPLSTTPPALPAPDLMLCLTLAWVLRRPDLLPALLIAAAFLLEDILLMRPPGLWAVIVLAGTEFLRARQPQMRDQSFLAEWSVVALIIAAMFVLERAVLTVTLVPMPDLGPALVRMSGTILIYPAVVVVLHLALGARGFGSGDAEAVTGGRKP